MFILFFFSSDFVADRQHFYLRFGGRLSLTLLAILTDGNLLGLAAGVVVNKGGCGG